MTRLLIIFIVLSPFNFSCKTDTSQQTDKEVKDSILGKYLSMVDTLPYYDTSNVDFKLLRAYYLNDTNTLKELQRHLEKMNTKLDWQINLDSCVNQQEFKDINSDERYRFNYSAAFCPYRTSLTIIKYSDSIILNTIVYQYAWDTVPCKIIEKTTINIDSLSWVKFQESLEIADFWGLKPDNGIHGVDGSELEVFGFKKGRNSEWHPNKSSFVSRWTPGLASLTNCFFLLVEFSKIKNGCFTNG